MPTASETLAIVKAAPSFIEFVPDELGIGLTDEPLLPRLLTPIAGASDAVVEVDTEDEDELEDAVADVQSVVLDGLRLTDDGLFTRRVTLEKVSGRSLSIAKTDAQLAVIIDAGLNSDRVKRGWSIRPAVSDEARDALGIVPTKETPSDGRYTVVGSPSDGWVYSVDVIVECRPKSIRRTLPVEAENIIAALNAKAKLPANRFRVAKVDGRPYVEAEATAITSDPNEELGYAPFDLPDEHAGDCPRDERGDIVAGHRCWLMNFGHLYGLEDFQDIIRSVLELAVMSDWKDRVNIALIGPPACGKTELCKAVKSAVGDESVLEYDATSTSMAGAQEQLGQLEELPRVLVLEEIEKAPESALPWLLSVLDLRGEVRKKTTRSDIAKSVHMVGICTVNDESKFKAVASGALASRFSMPLYFTRPPREILWKILKREVDKIGGSVEWIDPALDFAEELDRDKTGLIDPRKLIAICLTGRERLLLPSDHPKSFQGMYRRTMARRIDSTKAGA